MPLVVITGFPSSGKSTTASLLKAYLEEKRGCHVEVVSENCIVEDRNETYAESTKEKVIRSQLKEDVIRLLDKDRVVIVDGLNYIKGFRYELYCASKSAKTTQCTVYCDLSPEDAWALNESCFPSADCYTRETFDALVARYEAPSPHNRWDKPLLLSLRQRPLDCASAAKALFDHIAPPPNQSTQCQPLSSASFVYKLDRVTKDIISAVLEAQRSSLPVDSIVVPGTDERVHLPSGSQCWDMAKLSKIKRQFTAYTKSRGATSEEDVSKLASMFVQYLNSSLIHHESSD